MGRVEFKRPWPPLQAPACVRTAARRDEPEGTRSLPCWPCRAAAVAVVGTRMEKALRARPPLGQRIWWGRGGRARSMSATDLVAFSYGRRRPHGGGGSSPRQCAATQSCRDAAEIVRERRWRVLGAGGTPVDPVDAEAPAGTGPGLPCLPAVGGGEKGSTSPPPARGGRSSTKPPRSARRSGIWCFVGLGSSGPNAVEGRVPNVLGGAVHQRAAGAPKLGRAWEAGQARPGQEDNAATPARRS